jgi:hypothetical protein
METIIQPAPTGPITELEPGVYAGIPAHVYFALPYASQSTIKAVAASEEKHLHELNRPKVELDAKTIAKNEDTKYFGNWYHTYLLQNDQFDVHYAEGPAERRSNADKETYANLCEKHGGNEGVYRPRHLEQMKWMQNAFMGYDFPREILAETGHSELTLIWDEIVIVDGDEVTIRCKARIDRYNDGRMMGIDFKTTGDAEKLFGHTFFRKPLEYHVQCGFYARGLNKCGLTCKGFFYFAQEKTAPYQVRYKMVGQDVISRGWEDAEAYLQNYARFRKHGFQQPACDLLILPDWMQS